MNEKTQANLLHYGEKKFSFLGKIKGFPFKEDEESTNFAQFSVTKQADAKTKLIRFLLILSYIAFSIGYSVLFLVVVKIPYVLAVLPGLIIVLWFFTWKHTNIEYTYVSNKNTFYVFKTNGYGKTKELFQHNLNDSKTIIPYNDDFKDIFDTYSFSEILNYTSSPKCEDRYISVWEYDNKTIGVCFDASTKLLSSLQYYAKDKVVVTYVSR